LSPPSAEPLEDVEEHGREVAPATPSPGSTAAPEAKRLLSDNVSVAYAVSYLFGTAGVAWFLSRVGPRLPGVDLAAACAALGRGGGEDGEGEAGETLASGPFLIRAFRALGPPWAGATVGEVEAAHPGRLLIERVRHRGELHEA
jgi:putative transport protein